MGICAKKAPVLCRSSPSAYFPIFGHVPSESERKSSPAEEKKWEIWGEKKICLNCDMYEKKHRVASVGFCFGSKKTPKNTVASLTSRETQVV